MSFRTISKASHAQVALILQAISYISPVGQLEWYLCRVAWDKYEKDIGDEIIVILERIVFNTIYLGDAEHIIIISYTL